mmetsp:Transcript_38940/g.121991  ORF Transcript_38940/g.121991 Transcript_38940/m.121991 type:complete len:807 (-) Transcript_38940:535-2955(-)|eukprot:CAMPEP_0118861844 /NCGR_PEP_ID=MMETSP1163-20130328/7235_1 /TAXON_ID=124430 /ORGANISM="Phaeomonas parva, Strain CCMP2877" /LENGTH=806 /DNA_ID=CAMNT_0006795685 /DNA_START=46 /DNA_END=2466 /DNA_ORIENTATION=+
MGGGASKARPSPAAKGDEVLDTSDSSPGVTASNTDANSYPDAAASTEQMMVAERPDCGVDAIVPSGGGAGAVSDERSVGGGGAGAELQHLAKGVERSPTPDKENLKALTGKVQWRKGNLIGSGAFGRVYMGLNEQSGAIMAVKEIGFASEDKQEMVALQREVEFMKALRHQRVVQYLGAEIVGDVLHIFTEWVPGGSILTLLNRFGKLSETIASKYTKQTLEGLDFLHAQGVIHRDIKASNILVDDRGAVKLADFGSSTRIAGGSSASADGDSSMLSLRGTPYYMAPEVIRQESYDVRADIWSLGCTVLHMVTGCAPWADTRFQNPTVLMFHVASTDEAPPLPEDASPAMQGFLEKCFMRDHAARPGAGALLEHAFIVSDATLSATPVTSPAAGAGRGGVDVDEDDPSGFTYNSNYRRDGITRDKYEDAADDAMSALNDDGARGAGAQKEKEVDLSTFAIPVKASASTGAEMSIALYLKDKARAQRSQLRSAGFEAGYTTEGARRRRRTNGGSSSREDLPKSITGGSFFGKQPARNLGAADRRRPRHGSAEELKVAPRFDDAREPIKVGPRGGVVVGRSQCEGSPRPHEASPWPYEGSPRPYEDSKRPVTLVVQRDPPSAYYLGRKRRAKTFHAGPRKSSGSMDDAEDAEDAKVRSVHRAGSYYDSPRFYHLAGVTAPAPSGLASGSTTATCQSPASPTAAQGGGAWRLDDGPVAGKDIVYGRYQHDGEFTSLRHTSLGRGAAIEGYVTPPRVNAPAFALEGGGGGGAPERAAGALARSGRSVLRTSGTILRSESANFAVNEARWP